ncbi:MAG: CotH kinase family protein [Flavobacteriales bacterium]|nr:CotH kinase family protein [Flavobacteriales bacterium]
MLYRPLVLLVSATLLSCSASAQVVINEVSAANWSGPTDNFGEREDWIELYNSGGAAADLSGWYLSDSQNNNTKYQIAPGTTIPAGGRLVVWCSGRGTTAAPLHTNFKITQAAGERAVLSNASGTIVDNFQIVNTTQADHSWGRTTDGAAAWSLFLTPTPNAANAGASPSYYAATPTMSQPSGYHGTPINVAITAPGAGITIRYTTDGSTPTAASTAYAGPVAINTTTVLRARAFSSAAGVPPSFVETNTYFINQTHTLPILSCSGDQVTTLLNGNGGIEPEGIMEYFGANGVLRDKTGCTFDEHGQDSWAYQHRGFDFVARDQFGQNDGIHYPIFRTKDRDHFQRLIVKASAGDNYDYGPGQPAHIRDQYVQALSQVGDLRVDERSYEPAVVYINGQYWGVYDVREKVDDHDYTNYYYGQGEYDLQFIKTWGGTWSEYGGAQAQTDWDALVAYIMGNDMGVQANFDYVDTQLNWKSLIDYFCLNSYTVCADWLNWNTGWWRGSNPTGEHKKWGYILWDMDATFGHYTNFTGIPDQTANADPCAVEDLPNPGGQGHTDILEKLLAENEMVHDYYINRYIDLGNTLFNCDFMLPFLDSLVANIAPEMPGQVARWNGTLAGWQNNVQTLRTFIETRCVTIQQGLIDCYTLAGPFQVTFNVDPPLSGEIQVNSIVLPDYPFTGTYYGGINTTLAPIPETGWVFSHWEIFGADALTPSTTDSLVRVNFTDADSIVAHFIPPTRYDVMLDVVPANSGSITFDGTTYTSFPTVASVGEDVDVPFNINPALYYDFLYWDFKNDTVNTYLPGDSLTKSQVARYLTTDTVIAYLKPQDYVFYIANAFTPNGDGYNDSFKPIINVVDLATYELNIFDRWGGIIWSSNDPWAEWDGQASGKEVPSGVYAWQAYAVDAIKKDRYELFGHVTIVR